MESNLYGHKLHSTKLTQTIIQNDIFGIAETMRDSYSNDIDSEIVSHRVIKFPGVRFHKKGRCSGGFLIFIKSELYGQSIVLKSKTQFCRWIKVKIEEGDDLYLGFVYIPPMDSNIHQYLDYELMEMIQSEIDYFNELGKTIVLGDWNARLGNMDDNMNIDTDFDLDHEFFTSDWAEANIQERLVVDEEFNTFGRELIQLCLNTDMRIMNGRFGNVSSNWTCYSHSGGRSVVDFGLMNISVFPDVVEFQVGSQEEFSDHVVIGVKIQIQNQIKEQYEQWENKVDVQKIYKNGRGYKIRPEHHERFYQEMNSIFIKKQLDFVKTTIKDQNANILDSIKLFTDFLNVVSQTVFERKKHSMNREKSGFLSKKWYDLECSLLAEKVRTIKHLHGIVSPQHREAIKGYKKLCKRKKFNYELRISEQLRSLKGTEPKQFWDLLKQGFEKPKLGNIKMQNWFTYFSNLAKAEDDEEVKIRTHLSIPELDRDFESQEIREAVFYNLKLHKAAGIDGITNEILKWGLDWFLDIYKTIFNELWKQKISPDSWNEIFMIPIFKEGDLMDPSNYRGISLLSCLGKLYSTLLNNRLYNWAEKNQKISRWQGGFRKCKGCVQQCFKLLTTLSIQNTKIHGYKNKALGRVFACFVDFRKAYDSIRHSLLWMKLAALGVSSKMIEVIEESYKKISCRMKINGYLSEKWDYKLGLRQGCILSPLLFTLFIEDLISCLQTLNIGIAVADLVVFILMYADDLVLLAEDEKDLQKLLDELERYCKESQLEVNLKKTKIVIFEKKPSESSTQATFTFNDKTIEKIQSYRYLGIIFSANMTFNEHVEYAITKAKKGQYLFWKYVSRFHSLKVPDLMFLFNTMVMPIVMYGAEIWYPGLNQQLKKTVESFYVNNLRRILRVGSQTAIPAILLELGVFPVETQVKISLVKFAEKMQNNPTDKIFLNELLTTKNNKWSKFWNELMLECLQEPIIPQQEINQTFIYEATTKLQQNSAQIMLEQIKEMHSLSMYSVLKSSHQFEDYLSQISCTRKRTALSKFRLGNNILRIHTGTYTDEARESRKCRFCNGDDLEDEIHVFFECSFPEFQSLRNILQKQVQSEIYVDYAHPIDTLKSLLQKGTTSELFAEYVFQMFKVINASLKQTNKPKQAKKFKTVLI